MIKNKILFFLLIAMASSQVRGECGAKSYSINIQNGHRYILHLDECGVKPILLTATFSQTSNREDIIKNLVRFFSSKEAKKMESNFYDSKKLIKNLKNINLSKWHRLNKNYEFCFSKSELNSCKEFVRIKFRSGKLNFTYNRF